MSRRSVLTDTHKIFVANYWTRKTYNQTELASLYGVSRATIQRALIEQGVMDPYNHKEPEPVWVRSPNTMSELIRAITVDEVIEKVLPCLDQESKVPPAPLPQITEQLELDLEPELKTVWINLFTWGASMSYFRSEYEALAQVRNTTQYRKTISVEIFA